MLTFNYSTNFYFYCLINQDIRAKAVTFFREMRSKEFFWWGCYWRSSSLDLRKVCSSTGDFTE